MRQQHLPKERSTFPLLCLAALALLCAAGSARAQLVEEPKPIPSPTPSCERRVTARVVAFNQVIVYNRLGAVNPNGLMYALERDVELISPQGGMVAGNVRLRPDKRPRPIVLRMNVGDCLEIAFRNLITPGTPNDPPDSEDNPRTPTASIHVVGLQLVNNIRDDGSNVGDIPPIGGLVPVNGQTTYTLYAEREGNHLLYSTAATTGGEGDGGTLAHGLFGSVNVEPRNSRWYRSQVTRQEMDWATKRNPDGSPQTTNAGQPILDYEAKYPAGHKFANKPILNMLLDGTNEIFHSDLNAIITGPNRGNITPNPYPPVINIEFNRDQPFREFTVVYHDEIKAIQAFPQFNEKKADGTPNPLAHTLHSVRDAFAINYGTGGIGAEILANRLGLGPMGNCQDCLFEEFFLSSWTVGDPAMIVDRPASANVDANGNRIPNPQPATRAFFPDDPSNVHHSYLNDHVKFRVVHAGPKEHHIHHLHAHQWLRTPDSDKAAYLDSQAIGPASSFTGEIAYGGSGNLNKTAGDSIFHCHFYPHFAMGMWELWRVHDVFEIGTRMGPDGRPEPGSRKLPDGEIAAGTPIPGVIPVPTIAMAPMPSPAHQGYPFFIAGVIGHRPPKPPLDTIDDGGLPRHVIVAGTVSHHVTHDPVFSFVKARLDFDKHLETATAVGFPEAGTPAEQAAMTYHGQRLHPSFTPENLPANFVTNGLPRKSPANPRGSQPGSPYADPCVDKDGNIVGAQRLYKGANIQLDIKLNKVGWHFPQQRISALWNDVRPTLNGQRTPEPLFMRAHSGDCITFHHTNLVPRVYVQDDFQVRTPTDVMGQHIHLVKFDVTSSDGSANGWNYEDGSFSPEEVQERIRAINAGGGFINPNGTSVDLEPRQHPVLGLAGHDHDGNGLDDWLGAQTTVQRWFADPVRDNAGVDRTLNTVFTHDHFGPSTHQQVGLYAGLIVEQPNTSWFHSETGQQLSTGRPDGGPTSWQAKIESPNRADSFREFVLEFADFQLAYEAGTGGTAAHPVPDPRGAINPPVKKEIGLPFLVEKDDICPFSNFRPPCPEAIAAADVGTMSVNYRNEPIALRVFNPNTGGQSPGQRGDLSHAYRSLTNRLIPQLNTQNTIPRLTRGLRPGDPATPLLRVFENDKVRIRVLVGAHEEGHNFGVHGVKWLFQPADPNSGFRNNQMMGISEWFDFVVPPLPVITGNYTDFLYMPGAGVDDQWNGLWGIMRAYRGRLANDPTYQRPAEPAETTQMAKLAEDGEAEAEPIDESPEEKGVVDEDPSVEGPLETLGSNPDGQAPDIAAFNTDEAATDADPTVTFEGAEGAPAETAEEPTAGTETASLDGRLIGPNTSGFPVCPQDAARSPRRLRVTAVSAQNALPGGTLFYNSRNGFGGRLHDPTAIMFVRDNDLDSYNRLRPGAPREPLVLRARAGECIELRLRNRLPRRPPDLAGFNTLPMLIEHFNANQVRPSRYVGLHPQLMRHDVRLDTGVNVGLNPDRVIPPGGARTYIWYAGDVVNNRGRIVGRPIEFGATSLSSSDPIKHSNKGAIGAFIIEPIRSNWTLDHDTHAAGLVSHSGGVFREFVLLYQNDINLRMTRNVALPEERRETTTTTAENIPADTESTDPQSPSTEVGTTYGNDGSADGEFVNVARGINTGFPVPNLAEAEDSEDSGQKAFNYRTEPLWNRMNFAPNAPLDDTNDVDFTNSLNNVQVGADPVTPIFRAQLGQAVRQRVVMSGGHARNGTYMLHGHIWEEEPYTLNSTVIGSRQVSEWRGNQYGIGAQSHFDFLPKNGAGGKYRVRGDYLYRNFSSFVFDGGQWGLFRVRPEAIPTQVPDNQ
jgi:hypothetical protein